MYQLVSDMTGVNCYLRNLDRNSKCNVRFSDNFSQIPKDEKYTSHKLMITEDNKSCFFRHAIQTFDNIENE